MKTSFRLFLILCILVSGFYACTRRPGFEDPSGNQYPPVFQDNEEAGETVGQLLPLAGTGEVLQSVDHVVYLESGNTTYALVFYTSNLGQSNILIEYNYVAAQLASRKAYKCSGSCECQVLLTISPEGQVTIDCSCSSCTMTVNNF